MSIGIALGNVEDWTSFIFCATAGIFLYIALVDMIPELNSGHAHPYSSHEQRDTHCLELGLHLLGMCTGIAIMMLIALYEHDLKAAFGSEEHSH
jgi:zinc transporter ZupT